MDLNKRLLTGVALLALLAPTVMLAAEAGSGNNVGSHAFKVNIIGRPNDWKGDDTVSNSRTLFISLKTNADSVACEDSSGVIDDNGETFDAVPAGRQTIYFTTGDFAVIDRDATDGRAEIRIPADVDGYDMYIRVLGKPGGCLDADAYAYDAEGATYYFAGHLDANRKTGAPEKIRVDQMFYVWMDTDGDGVVDTQVSVFDALFDEYFWQIENNGLRNMQLIFVAA